MDPDTSTTSSQQPEKNNTMMFVIGIVVLLLIGIGIVFMMNRNNTQPQTAVQNTAPQPTTAAAATESPTTAVTVEPSGATTEDAATTKEFTVTGKNFSFSPSTIRVKKGDTVKITFKNTGGFHDFTIDEYNVHTPQIQDGKSAEVEFVANKVGTVDYYCSVGQHRANGMEGKLIVE